MFDGINSLAAGIAKDFPSLDLVAGYVNGGYAWSSAEWALFAASKRVEVSVTASADAGDVLDVETGDATPDQTEGWIRTRKASGLYRPTIYCNLSTVPAVRTGTGPYVLGTDYDLWIADYDGTTASPYAGCAAKQYKSTGTYDESVVYDDNWPHRTAAASVPAVPTDGTTKVTYDSATIHFTGVASAVKYRIQVYKGDSTSGTLIHDAYDDDGTAGKDGVTVTGLSPSTVYGWRVVATDASGASGAWSGLVKFTTAASPSAFAAPAGLAEGTEVIRNFTWKAVAAVDGVSPSGYTLEAVQNNGVVVKGTTSGTSGTIRLVKGWQYQVRAWADDSTGKLSAPPHASLSITA